MRERLAEAIYRANGFALYGRRLGDWNDPESRVSRGERDRWLRQADAILPLITEARREVLRELYASFATEDSDVEIALMGAEVVRVRVLDLIDRETTALGGTE
jgi:hypothetical protein